MARGRMLNRDVAIDGKVADYGGELGPLALVFHHRLIAFLDVNGNTRADPWWLKAQVMPRVDACSPDDCLRFARGLVEHGMAVAYEHDGLPYLHFPRFRDNQHGLRPEKERPDVPVPQGFDEAEAEMPDSFRQPSAYSASARRNGGGTPTSPARDEVEVESEVESEVEEQTLPETRGDSGEAEDPAQWMHAEFLRQLGGDGRQPDLLEERRTKYRKMHGEQLSKRADPRAAWRGVLETLRASDHHMSKRDYHMPESFLGNATKRERWMLKSEQRGPPDGLTEADRKIIRRRRELEGQEL